MKLVDVPADVFTSSILKHLSLEDVIAIVRSCPLMARYARDGLRSLQSAPTDIFPKDETVVAALKLRKYDGLFGDLPNEQLRVFVHYVLHDMEAEGQTAESPLSSSFLRYATKVGYRSSFREKKRMQLYR